MILKLQRCLIATFIGGIVATSVVFVLRVDAAGATAGTLTRVGQPTADGNSVAAAQIQREPVPVEVQPNLYLPPGNGFYIVDGDRISLVDQVQMRAHSSSENNTAPPKETAEGGSIYFIRLPGESAKLRVHSTYPKFYFRPSDKQQPEFILVRAEIRNHQRELKNSNEVAIHFHGGRGVYFFMTLNPLPPGEYAVLEKNPDGSIADHVWDFGAETAAKTVQDSK